MLTTNEIQEIIVSKAWYYAQGLGNRKNQNIIILANNKKEAIEKADKWKARVGFEEYHLYKNNYKPEARNLLARGLYV